MLSVIAGHSQGFHLLVQPELRPAGRTLLPSSPSLQLAPGASAMRPFSSLVPSLQRPSTHPDKLMYTLLRNKLK